VLPYRKRNVMSVWGPLHLSLFALCQIYSTLHHSSTPSSLKCISMYDGGGCNIGYTLRPCTRSLVHTDPLKHTRNDMSFLP
jgi:hypothetical protein